MQLLHTKPIPITSMKTHMFTLFYLCLLPLSPWPLLFIITFSIFTLLSLLLVAHFTPGGLTWYFKPSPPNGDQPIEIPGPSGWPLLGSIPLMGPLAHRKLAHLSSSLGAKRLLALSLGTTRLVVASDVNTAREILSGHAFADRPPKSYAEILMFDRAIGFAPHGEYWRHLRHLASTNMFSPRRIAVTEGIRQRVVSDMMGHIEEEMEVRGAVEMREVLQRGALRSVMESVVGSCGEEEWKEMIWVVREGYELIGRWNWEDYFPKFGRILDFHGGRKKCQSLALRVKGLFGEIIEKRRRDDHGAFMGDDLLSVLLSPPETDRLSDSDMIAVLWEMIFRGADVVAILMEWIMARIVLHPEIQADAQQEIDKVIGPFKPVQQSDIPNLRYLQAVVKEVLRLHPPGPLLSWARLAIHDVHVGKYYVPAGTAVMVNMWAITHDESVWKDPWAFCPNRFFEEDVSVMGSDLRLSPFGSGRRVCPGRALGLVTVHLWLARLLQEYKWLPGGEPVTLAESLRLSMEMKKPLVCRAIPRNLK